jgi:hypothetical protein
VGRLIQKKTRHVIVIPSGHSNAITPLLDDLESSYPLAKIEIHELNGQKLEDSLRGANRIYVDEKFQHDFARGWVCTSKVIFFRGVDNLVKELKREIPASGLW